MLVLVPSTSIDREGSVENMTGTELQVTSSMRDIDGNSSRMMHVPCSRLVQKRLPTGNRVIGDQPRRLLYIS